MIERTIPTDIDNDAPTSEQKKEIYKGEYVSITYYPGRIQGLKDKILYPFNILRYKYIKRKYSIILGRKGSGKVRSCIKPIDTDETDR